MKIQLINYSGDNVSSLEVEECNSFGNAVSLDSFDLNIIDLSDQLLWRNTNCKDNYHQLDSDQDLFTLSQSVVDSMKTRFLYILPKNHFFGTSYNGYYSSNGVFQSGQYLKDIPEEFHGHLNKIIKTNFTLTYEKTFTILDGIKFFSDFYFRDSSRYGFGVDIISENEIRSDGSNKLVCLTKANVTLTTLQVTNRNELSTLIAKISPSNPEEDVPDWFNTIKFFDDNKQFNIIDSEKLKIEKAQDKIKKSEEIINCNKYYKSILFKAGSDLETVLTKMLVEMLEVKSDFEDTKDEDFSFEKDGVHYLFEFKGLTKDVKKSNISQLITHVHKYSEKNKVSDENIRRIIIVNRFKHVAPKDRPSVSHNVIDVAKNQVYNVLIIDTLHFLKLFEKYKSGEMTVDDIFSIFDQTGVFELS
ncbi:hypothetical protein [Streptococcus sanguinis]|jgi:hypothetical protein|uniref:hypothetical protein n=3 Tax=Streptococcus sanguinis TaxID=1305 RepID=UPI001694742D|nr:hypothetical protein [Streptococcus sanguinis]KAF1306489.1 hypothetical protein I925_09547 [Streptococcus sanguinis OH0843]